MFDLKSRVGFWEKNRPDDVAKVQLAIHNAGHTDLNISGGPTGIFGKPDHDGLMDLQRERGLNIDGKVAPGGETISNLKQSAFPGSLSKVNNPISDQTQQFPTARGDQKPEYQQYASRTDVANDASNTEGGKPKKNCLALKQELRELNKQIMKEGSKLAELERNIHNLKLEIERIEAEIKYESRKEVGGKLGGLVSRIPIPFAAIGGAVSEGIGIAAGAKVAELEAELGRKMAMLEKLKEDWRKLEGEVYVLETTEILVRQDYDECRRSSGDAG